MKCPTVFFAIVAGTIFPATGHASTTETAQIQISAKAAFELAQLPYSTDALAPVIDSQTMTIHHGKHHRAYVDALNKAVAADTALQGHTLEQLVANAGKYAPVVRNNAGGHWNHSFFWESMAAPEQSSGPSAALLAAITRSFGSLDAMKIAFKQAGTSRFGSGWAWLLVKADGTLAIGSTPNQDNPLMDVAEVRGQPILGNDVWEHAYYLTYQNRRADYLDAWWRVVSWEKVSQRYNSALANVK
ncbi:MAG: superoxide dismutase [Sphingorhabdus sp.]